MQSCVVRWQKFGGVTVMGFGRMQKWGEGEAGRGSFKAWLVRRVVWIVRVGYVTDVIVAAHLSLLSAAMRMLLSSGAICHTAVPPVGRECGRCHCRCSCCFSLRSCRNTSFCRMHYVVGVHLDILRSWCPEKPGAMEAGER